MENISNYVLKSRWIPISVLILVGVYTIRTLAISGSSSLTGLAGVEKPTNVEQISVQTTASHTDEESFVTEPDGDQSKTWTPPYVPEELQGRGPNDPELIRHIRDFWLIRPHPGPRHLAHPGSLSRSQVGQDLIVDKLLDERRGGFFVECGAAEGEGLSNTLYFEEHRDWTGLLVEANVGSFRQVLAKRRSAWAINACLSSAGVAERRSFTQARLMGGLTDDLRASHAADIQDRGRYAGDDVVQCFPLAAILAAVGRTSVDYFSLDVEGPEIPILNSLSLEGREVSQLEAPSPGGSLFIDVISVEYRVNGGAKGETASKRDALTSLLEAQGYRVVDDLSNLDLILRRG